MSLYTFEIISISCSMKLLYQTPTPVTQNVNFADCQYSTSFNNLSKSTLGMNVFGSKYCELWGSIKKPMWCCGGLLSAKIAYRRFAIVIYDFINFIRSIYTHLNNSEVSG